MLTSNFLKRKPVILGLVAGSMIAGGLYYYFDLKKQYSHPNTLYAALDYYGFQSTKQKAAIRLLMTSAGIKDTDILLDKKAANEEALVQAILDFVRVTQEHFTIRFTIRQGTQERWDVQTSGWMQDPAAQPKILNVLALLDITDTVAPTFTQRDLICVLGSCNKFMKSRLNYVGNLFEQGKLPAKHLGLLTGERYVTADKNGFSIDGSPEELLAVSKQLNKSLEMLTETDLMTVNYQGSEIYGKLPTDIIHTPKGNLPRPTTETTVGELCAWLRKHSEIQSVTFVSDQPYVGYQKAIIGQVWEQQKMQDIKFEVIAFKYNPPASTKTEDKIRELVGALGSQIWASTPVILDTMGLKIGKTQLPEYMKLYEKNPFIYNNLRLKFKSP